MPTSDRPTILITAGSNTYTDRRGSPAVDWVISDLYALKVEKAGGTCIAVGPLDDSLELSPRVHSLGELMDGLIVTGGAFDIPPPLYGAHSHPQSGPFDEARTQLELELIKTALKANKPILGICGGMQLLNVALGGNLIQDLSLLKEPLVHEQIAPRSEPGHMVEVVADTLLAKLVGKGEMGVNSTHHQVVGHLGQGLKASAIAEDGVIEAIEMKEREFVVGVQWHPEAMSNIEHSKIFHEFVQAAERTTRR